VFFLFVACLLGLLALTFLYPPQEEPVSRVEIPAVEARPVPPEPSAEFTARTLRTRLEQVAAEYPGTYGIVVSDPSSGKTVALNADQRFMAASLTKLPVLFTLYRAAARGEVNLEDEISMLESDVQAYGTGVLYTRRVGYTMTLRECAEFMIKESDNTAWKMLNRYLGRRNIEADLYEIGARSTAYWIPNTTTPNDVLLMLEAIADPSYTTPELSAEMLDLMTHTSFEDRLPQPLPEGTRVAHKIGSYGDTFSDAGLVFPEDSRSTDDAYFIVVIAGDTTEWTARSAIQDISLATYRLLGPARP
jgi:beta-lactamase class A